MIKYAPAGFIAALVSFECVPLHDNAHNANCILPPRGANKGDGMHRHSAEGEADRPRDLVLATGAMSCRSCISKILEAKQWLERLL